MFFKKPKAIGIWGEEQVIDYLKKKNYQILCHNYYSRYGEIDIIAKKDDILAFVEVKTRAKNSICSPAEAVTVAKQKKIYLTALHYLEEYGADLQPRFDVCEVYVLTAGKSRIAEINYLENAFNTENLA